MSVAAVAPTGLVIVVPQAEVRFGALRADLGRHGPVSAHCDSVRLLENASGRWREMHEFALVGDHG